MTGSYTDSIALEAPPGQQLVDVHGAVESLQVLHNDIRPENFPVHISESKGGCLKLCVFP